MIEDVNYYALGATWDDIDKTKDFVEQGIWENGWDDGSNENIIKQIKVGDYIVLKSSYTRMKNLPFDNHNKSVSVMKIKAIGRVAENPQDGKILKIKYEDDFKPREIFGFTYRRTVSIINKEKWPEEIEWIFFNKPQSHYYTFSQKNIGVESLNIKNIILYGAPGVGKTHNYKNLISMIEEGNSQKEIFDTISKNQHVDLDNETFETIKKEKRVEFVTFHQSYSYEDFIEGFRPNESGNIELEDGIFKNIADKAKLNLEDSQKNKKEVEIKYSFSKLLDEFKIFVEDKISTDGTFFLKGKATISNIGKSSFLVGGSVSSEQKLTFNILERDYDNFKNGFIKSYKDIKPTFESEKGVHGNAPYYFALYERLKEFEDTVYEDSTQEKLEVIEQKNFYIIIDEINRGNISKIFGELITLIEEDKRDVYEVTLPYSKEKFKVPSNLYIIATMNSTDKSIATIDIALRRRFTFLKMKPNESLILHVRAKELFNTLNSFIKEKLSEDYMLGHSYFMNINDDEDLEFVKEYKIRPLLEEYFYADDENFKKAEEMLTNSKGKTNE